MFVIVSFSYHNKRDCIRFTLHTSYLKIIDIVSNVDIVSKLKSWYRRITNVRMVPEIVLLIVYKQTIDTSVNKHMFLYFYQVVE